MRDVSESGKVGLYYFLLLLIAVISDGMQ